MRALPAIFTALVLLSDATARAATSYTVTVAGEKPRSVHVVGTFLLESNTLGMYVTRSPQLEDGQAALIRSLAVRDENGEAVAFEYQGQGDWKLPRAAPGQRVEIEYDVALEHGKYSWGPGIDEVAYQQEDGLFFTGFSLFILPGVEDTGEVTVRFQLPDDWRASTPWADIDGTGKSFRAASMMDLARNCFFLGDHLEESVSIGDFEFILAIGGRLKAKKQLFVDAMAPLLPAYVETFGGMPSASRYLVVINPGDRSDGGAFPGSYSMLIRGEVNRASSVVWGHGIAHELLHFWNGHTLSPASHTDEAWFKEGFTDYLTIVHLSRSGLDPREVTYRKLENMARRYLIAKRLMGIDDSMRAAGAEKHRKRFLVYGGGALVAFALDVRIRQETRNEAGLDDFMRAMFRELGVTGKPYTFEDIGRLASAVGGSDQRGFLERYVDGNEVLDVTPYFDAIGLRLTTMMDEFYLSPRSDATASQRAMAHAIFGSAIDAPAIDIPAPD